MKQTFDQFTHELNNTFSVVKINSELLISSLEDQKLMRFAARIKHNNDQAIELVKKYGRFVELSAYPFVQKIKKFSLQELINGIIKNRDIEVPILSEEIVIQNNKDGLNQIFIESIELVERSELTTNLNQLKLERNDKHVRLTIRNGKSNVHPLLIKNQNILNKLEKQSVINQYSVGIIQRLSEELNTEVIINCFNNDFIIQISFPFEMKQNVCHAS